MLHAAQLRNLRSGAVLAVSSSPEQAGLASVQLDPSLAPFPCGTPVELTLPSHLLLGEVIESRSGQLLVQVEHMLDRAAVTSLQEAWR